jgi:hypothetical protein
LFRWKINDFFKKNQKKWGKKEDFRDAQRINHFERRGDGSRAGLTPGIGEISPRGGAHDFLSKN